MRNFHSVILTLAIPVLLLFPQQDVAAEAIFEQATIYLIDWNVQTRSTLTIHEVRQKYELKLELRDQQRVRRLLESLGPEIMISNSGGDVNDGTNANVRLVIDFTAPDGETDTYYAGLFKLYLLGTTKFRKIDPEFRDRFKTTAIDLIGKNN